MKADWRCLFFHAWKLTKLDGPYPVGDGFASAFGNGWAVSTCSRCGKTKRLAARIAEAE